MITVDHVLSESAVRQTSKAFHTAGEQKPQEQSSEVPGTQLEFPSYIHHNSAQGLHDEARQKG